MLKLDYENLYGVVRWKVRKKVPAQDVDDVVQDIMEHVARLSDKIKHIAYVYSIINGKIVEYHRRQNAYIRDRENVFEYRDDDCYLSQNLPSYCTTPEDQLLQKEIKSKLFNVIRSIGGGKYSRIRTKTVIFLLLLHFETGKRDRKREGIADMLRLTPGNVASALFLGKSKIRKGLKNYWKGG